MVMCLPKVPAPKEKTLEELRQEQIQMEARIQMRAKTLNHCSNGEALQQLKSCVQNFLQQEEEWYTRTEYLLHEETAKTQEKKEQEDHKKSLLLNGACILARKLKKIFGWKCMT